MQMILSGNESCLLRLSPSLSAVGFGQLLALVGSPAPFSWNLLYGSSDLWHGGQTPHQPIPNTRVNLLIASEVPCCWRGLEISVACHAVALANERNNYSKGRAGRHLQGPDPLFTRNRSFFHPGPLLSQPAFIYLSLL